jgi:hypothetical protein
LQGFLSDIVLMRCVCAAHHPECCAQVPRSVVVYLLWPSGYVCPPYPLGMCVLRLYLSDAIRPECSLGMCGRDLYSSDTGSPKSSSCAWELWGVLAGGCGIRLYMSDTSTPECRLCAWEAVGSACRRLCWLLLHEEEKCARAVLRVNEWCGRVAEESRQRAGCSCAGCCQSSPRRRLLLDGCWSFPLQLKGCKFS